MSDQPRQKDGKFDRKLSPAPSAAPSVPDRGQIADKFEEYDHTGARQEQALSEGLHQVGEGLDAIAEIYRERARRREAEIEANQERLQRIQDQLDEMSARRSQIEEELRMKEERKLSNRIKRLFTGKKDEQSK